MNFDCFNNKIFMSFIVFFVLFLYGFGERLNNICGITPGYVITATENHIKLYQIILFKYFPQSPQPKIYLCWLLKCLLKMIPINYIFYSFSYFLIYCCWNRKKGFYCSTEREGPNRIFVFKEIIKTMKKKK